MVRVMFMFMVRVIYYFIHIGTFKTCYVRVRVRVRVRVIYYLIHIPTFDKCHSIYCSLRFFF